MTFRMPVGCLLAFFIAGSSVAANEHLPDWLSISPTLSTSVLEGRGDAFPSDEDRAAWEGEGYGFVDLLWRVEIHIERSGMIELRIEIVRHFLTESGISQGGNMELYADAWRDRLTIETGYSMVAEASPVFIDPNTIEAISSAEANVFSDWQRIIFPVPGLRPGSNATIAGTRRFQSADFPLSWSSSVTLGSIVPIARIEIIVSRQEGAPEITWDSNDPDLRCEDLGARGLSCTRIDVPAVSVDRDVLSYSDLIPHFYVGHTETWNELQDSLRALIEEAATPTPALREKVKELGIAPDASHEEKLWKLLRFVADEIRYVSLSHGDSTVVPRPASLTLARRYGDCKDKVALLVALAKIAEMDLIPVLTSTARKDLQKILRPASTYFDHMIACLEMDSGESLCVDPTQAYSGLELPPQLGGAIALWLGRESEAVLTNLGTTDFGWEVLLERELTLERDGSVGIRDVRRFAGPGAAANRTQILALPFADRKASVEVEYREAHGTTTTPSLTFRSLRNAAVPWEIESRTSSAGGYVPDSGEFYSFDSWLIYYARTMISINRHHPYRLLGLRYTSEEIIHLCCGEIEFPGPTLEFESKYGSLRRSSRKVNDKVVVKAVFELPAAVISPEEVPMLESFIMQSLRESGHRLSWRPEN